MLPGKLTRRSLLGGIAASSLLPREAGAAFAIFQVALPPPGQSFAQIPIGGGGYVTGLDLAADGTFVVRIDVFGAYSNNTGSLGTWQNLFTTASIPSALWGFSSGDAGGTFIDPTGGVTGVYEIRIAPTNTNIFYALWSKDATHAVMLISTNKGSTWTQMTNFPAISWSADANGGSRFFAQKMAIDPANADVVYIGTPADGLYVTTNGTSGASATFTQVSTSSVPNSTGRNGICGICFDPTSAVTGGKTQRLIVGSNGNGCYETTNGGSTWAAAGSGSPTAIQGAVFSGGVYYVGTGTNAEIYSGGTWTASIVSNGMGPMAVSPTDSTWIAGWCAGQAVLNQGVISGTSITWNGPYPVWTPTTTSPSDTGWIANTVPAGTYMSAGGFAFDPSVTGRMWFSWGYGVTYCDMPSKNAVFSTNLTFNQIVKGIQNMVARCIVSQSGFSLLVAVEDQQVFQITSLTSPPSSSTVQLGTRSKNNAAWSMDQSLSVSGVVVVLCSGEGLNANNYTSFSTDGGTTWTPFSAVPTIVGIGGACITCAGSSQFCMVPVGATTPYYWTGSAWTASTGVPSATYSATSFDQPQLLTNDAGGGIYAYAPSHGLYKSTNGGLSFTLIDATNVLNSSYQASLRAVPGQAQTMFLTYGYDAGTPYPNLTAATKFYTRTSDGGTWSAISNVSDVFCFGFGQIYPTGGWTKPTLWLFGFVNSGGSGYKWGLWRTRDLGVSDWTWVTDWPGANFDMPICVSGDMNDYTKVYIGYDGSSFIYGTGIA